MGKIQKMIFINRIYLDLEATCFQFKYDTIYHAECQGYICILYKQLAYSTLFSISQLDL